MKIKMCVKCGKDFPYRIVIDGVTRNLKSRKFCLECSPFGQQSGARANLSTSPHKECKYCGKPLTDNVKQFCNTSCFHEYNYREYISDWKANKIDGTKGKSWVKPSNYVRRYLFEKYDNKCARCGWSETNMYTDTIPLEIEHLDGDARNNCEENLILLCPNCHSLTSTYRGANRGNGTRNITWIPREEFPYVNVE